MVKVGVGYTVLYFAVAFGRAQRGNIPFIESLVLAVVLALLLGTLFVHRCRAAKVTAFDDRIVVSLMRRQPSPIHYAHLRNPRTRALGGIAFDYEGVSCTLGLPFCRQDGSLAEFLAAKASEAGVPGPPAAPQETFCPDTARARRMAVAAATPFILLAALVALFMFPRATAFQSAAATVVTLAMAAGAGYFTWGIFAKRRVAVFEDRFTAFIYPLPPATIRFAELTGVNRNLAGIWQIAYDAGEIFYMVGGLRSGGVEFIDFLRRRTDR